MRKLPRSICLRTVILVKEKKRENKKEDPFEDTRQS